MELLVVFGLVAVVAFAASAAAKASRARISAFYRDQPEPSTPASGDGDVGVAAP